jgi:hypothetical protein
MRAAAFCLGLLACTGRVGPSMSGCLSDSGCELASEFDMRPVGWTLVLDSVDAVPPWSAEAWWCMPQSPFQSCSSLGTLETP